MTNVRPTYVKREDHLKGAGYGKYSMRIYYYYYYYYYFVNFQIRRVILEDETASYFQTISTVSSSSVAKSCKLTRVIPRDLPIIL